MANVDKLLTEQEQKFYDVLVDGLPHTREELHALLWDDQGSLSNIRQHVSNMRKKLPPGFAIICELYKRKLCYRMVGLMRPAD